MEANINFLKRYMPRAELAALLHNLDGEEGEFFQEMLAETEQKIKAVPPLYANEELGANARVRLHYFGGASDFWISELDPETGDAFGYACMNGDDWNAELGYVNIPEIVETGFFELDLYWDDETTLKDVMAH